MNPQYKYILTLLRIIITKILTNSSIVNEDLHIILAILLDSFRHYLRQSNCLLCRLLYIHRGAYGPCKRVCHKVKIVNKFYLVYISEIFCITLLKHISTLETGITFFQ